jgi:hypothetical protein
MADIPAGSFPRWRRGNLAITWKPLSRSLWMVSQTFTSWNRIEGWLQRIESLRAAE